MSGFNFEKMQEIQKELQEKYKDKWDPLSPDRGRDKLLWMMIEAGEIADVIKNYLHIAKSTINAEPFNNYSAFNSILFQCGFSMPSSAGNRYITGSIAQFQSQTHHR